MQINLSAQGDRIAAYGLEAEDMLEPDACILVAASYLRDLFDEYEDCGTVLCIYNGNTTGLREYRATGKLPEYAAEVLERSADFEIRHGK